jgi:hypothetical protein
MEIEEDLSLAVGKVFASEPETPKQFEKAIKKLQRPLEEQYELAIVMMLIMFAEQYPDSSLGDELVKKNSPLDKAIRRRAQILADRQVKHLNRLVQRTNRKAAKSDQEDEVLADRLWGSDRVSRIAITETTKCINIGEHEALFFARKFGMDAYATWFTAEDERVCPICQPFHGTTEEVWGEEFPYGGPAHVRCRCSLVWTIREPESE